MSRRRPFLRGFTLIELLVVVTIIVVLLALLVPAMDKAIYQAELTVCGSQLKGIGTSVTTYAMENKRYYPDRGLQKEQFGSDQPAIIKYHEAYAAYRGDQRSVLRKAMPALNKQLNDPLTGEIDMENTLANWVFTPYNLWWGFSYLTNTDPPARRKTMLKVGERWSCNPYGRPNAAFDVLAGDRDQISPDPNILEVQSSHPDGVHEPGVLFNKVMQDEVAPWVFATGTITFSLWWSQEQTTYKRGLTDDNFVMGDLSVQRFDRVHWNHGEENRLLPVGIFASQGGTGPPETGRYQYVP